MISVVKMVQEHQTDQSLIQLHHQIMKERMFMGTEFDKLAEMVEF